MTRFEPARYHPPLAALWATDRLPDLGPGRPNASVRDALAALTLETAFPSIRDRSAARACISGLWLYHDFLDESHTISQDLGEWYGSYWHGIMHRREPDASNSKYWFRRVPANPVFEQLAADGASLGYPLRDGRWNPAAFVDDCEAERSRRGAHETLLRQVQLREMQLLFTWCYEQAVHG